MAKVLVFNFPGEGHINPTIALVEELVQRGEEVVYYCVEEYRNKIEKTGAAFRSYENFLSIADIMKKMDKEFNLLDKMSGLAKKMDKVIDDILSQVKEEVYDYVIYDNNFAVGRIVADVLKLPKISSCTTFALNKYVFSDFKGRQGEIDQESPEYQDILAVFKEWEKKYGIRIDGIKDMMSNPGDITLVFTSKLYQPHAEMFDDSFKFVGPSVAPRKDEESVPFEKIQSDPLIFISMGTVFNQQPELYHTCFEAFRESEATVILTVGKRTDISQFKDIPANFLVYHYVPQLEVLQRADVFVTHGGMNSSSEGLYFGVPLVVIPVTGDQPIIAKRVEALGAGLQLDRTDLCSDMLHDTTERVLHDPQFAENSRKIGISLKEAGGYKKAADEILMFKQKYQMA